MSTTKPQTADEHAGRPATTAPAVDLDRAVSSESAPATMTRAIPPPD